MDVRTKLIGSGLDADPYPAYARLRDERPVCRVRLRDNAQCWVVSRYEDARSALADPRLSRDPRVAGPAWREADRGRPLEDGAGLGVHLISALVADHKQGRLSQTELLSMIFLLLIAGHENTAGLIGNGIIALLESPRQLALLRERALAAPPERLRRQPSSIVRALHELPVVFTPNLRKDPSLRLNEAGRDLLRWLDARTADPEMREKLVDPLPPHCSYLLAEFAQSFADSWLTAANRLKNRLSEAG